MSSAPVFNFNAITSTTSTPDSSDSTVQSLMTANTKGAINSTSFLQFTNTTGNNLQQGSNVLPPGAQQVLTVVGNRSINIDGNQTIYIKGDASHNAFALAVGKDRQSLVQGVNYKTKANQTGLKEELWDTETTTNEDQVRVSYFLPSASTQNSENTRFTFENETLIQWGNRTLQRWSTDTREVVGTVSQITEGNELQTIHGNLHETNYAGVSVEAIDGGFDLHLVVGLKTLYQEGLNWVMNLLGAGLLLHLYVGVFQVIGTAASLLKGTIVQNKIRNVTAQVKVVAMRVGTGAMNILDGALSGIPRI
jgi:hypothetical protein